MRPTGNAARAALFAGVLAAFIAAALVLDAIGAVLLVDADPGWALSRLLLTLLLIIAAGAAGVAFAGGVYFAGRTRAVRSDLERVDLPRRALAATGAAALLLGACVRFAGLESLPFPLWHDELLVLPQALALQGNAGDFRDTVRMVLDDGGRHSGTVGVLYLEAFRASLRIFGTTVFGVRFLSAAGGVLSLCTAMLLGRALLPRGGGTLAGLVLAGLRWSLIVSRWGWNMIVLVPLVDVATLVALRARRRGGAAGAALAGALAGLGAHVYLSAWIAAAALGLVLLWPSDAPARRWLLGASFAAGFALAVLPLFLFHAERQGSYLVRAGKHNMLLEIQQTRSPLPLVRATRTALLGPWVLPDPSPRIDLAGKTRLPILLAVALLTAFLRAGARPGDDLSALLWSHAGMALLASLAWGERLSPNGSRFAYLTSITAVGVAAGLLWWLGLLPLGWRRAGALLVIGGLFIGFAHATVQLGQWARQPGMYVEMVGQHTTVGWAAARWERYGRVRLEASPLYATLTIDTIRQFRILPRREAAAAPPAGARARAFRICPPEASPLEGERVVERVRDGWGKDWAVVFGRKGEGRPGEP